MTWAIAIQGVRFIEDGETFRNIRKLAMGLELANRVVRESGVPVLAVQDSGGHLGIEKLKSRLSDLWEAQMRQRESVDLRARTLLGVKDHSVLGWRIDPIQPLQLILASRRRFHDSRDKAPKALPSLSGYVEQLIEQVRMPVVRSGSCSAAFQIRQ